MEEENSCETPLRGNIGETPLKGKDEITKEGIDAIIMKKIHKREKDDDVSNSYDTSQIDSLSIETEEKERLLKLSKKVLLAHSSAHSISALKKLFGYIKSLFITNIFYFLIFGKLFSFIFKTKKEEKKHASIWLRLLLLNIPELIIIFFYRRKIIGKMYRALNALFCYLTNKIIYLYNSDSKNMCFCQLDEKYNIYVLKKNGELEQKVDYSNNNKEFLAKETCFESVIAYPNCNFEDFDFKNLTKDEEKIVQEIFSLINNVENKVNEVGFLPKIVGYFAGNLSYKYSSELLVLKSLGAKLISFFLRDILLEKKKTKKRNELFQERVKDFNQKNMNNGYFLVLNNDVILLFKIKEEYKSFDEHYSQLYDEGENLLKHFFN